MVSKTKILIVIVIAQFLCTSLWFAGNGVLSQLSDTFQLPAAALGYLTSSVQLGFILGTFLFAFFTLADRFSPSKVFCICAFLGAGTNLAMLSSQNSFTTLLVIRFVTGFFMAGIYPVGMKIAADYFNKGLGKSLGYLVGALVLGTAFPHFINTFTLTISWKWVIITTSIIAMLGGISLLLCVPDGPYRKKATIFDISILKNIFKRKEFKKAAFGYFGHMWELYAFWAFVPVILSTFQKNSPAVEISIPFWSFIIIGIGSVGCIVAGYVSAHIGTKRTAVLALSISGICCLTSPLLFQLNKSLFLACLVLWGMVVIADSPMFSTLVAQKSTAAHKATALTIVNCIGFAITIISIQLLSFLAEIIPLRYVFVVLVLGPLFGLFSLRKPATNC